MLKTLVVERIPGNAGRWRAYFADDDERYGQSELPTYGVGNRESEATAAILQQKLGELVLQDPGAFGLVLERR